MEYMLYTVYVICVVSTVSVWESWHGDLDEGFQIPAQRTEPLGTLVAYSTPIDFGISGAAQSSIEHWSLFKVVSRVISS